MSRKKKSKSTIAISKLTQEESNLLGIEAEKLMTTKLQFLVYSYTKSCRYLVKETFGWESEDLHQYMAESIWKGLATYDDSKNIKKNTYLSVIFKNSMSNLIKACHRDKRRNTRLCHQEDFIMDKETDDNKNGEDWAIYQNVFRNLINTLTEDERKVMAYHLAYGMNIIDICRKTKLKRLNVVSILKEVKDKMEMANNIIEKC